MLPSRRVLVVLPGLAEAGPQPEHGQHDSRMGSAVEKYCMTMSSMYNQRLLYICHYYLFFELFTSPPLCIALHNNTVSSQDVRDVGLEPRTIAIAV